MFSTHKIEVVIILKMVLGGLPQTNKKHNSCSLSTSLSSNSPTRQELRSYTPDKSSRIRYIHTENHGHMGRHVYIIFENTHHLEAVRAAVNNDKIFGRHVKATDTPVHERAMLDKGGGSNTTKGGKKGKGKGMKWEEERGGGGAAGCEDYRCTSSSSGVGGAPLPAAGRGAASAEHLFQQQQTLLSHLLPQHQTSLNLAQQQQSINLAQHLMSCQFLSQQTRERIFLETVPVGGADIPGKCTETFPGFLKIR